MLDRIRLLDDRIERGKSGGHIVVQPAPGDHCGNTRKLPDGSP
jgi:hypothetical protein